MLLGNKPSTGKNIIIGGDFSTNPWQRGTSFAAIAHGGYCADRFVHWKSGTMVNAAAKTADAPTLAEAGILTQHCLDFSVSTAQSSLGTDDYTFFDQRIEGYIWKNLAQQSFALSFWVKATVTGTYSVSFINSGLDRSYVSTYTVNTTNTWEKKNIVVAASPSAGTWDYTNGVGLIVRFVIAGGTSSTFSTSTLNSWQSANKEWSTTQANGVNNTANHFKIALIQLEAGSSTTQFESRPVQTELALAQRYYARLNTVRSIGYPAAGGNFFCFPMTNPVTMRAAPTLSVITAPTYNNAGTFAAGTGTNATTHVVQATASAGGQAFFNADGVYDLSSEL